MNIPSRVRAFLPPLAGWLLGLFALWQLLFPIVANLLEFVPIRPTAGDQNPPLESTQRWGRFTENDHFQSSAETLGYAVAGYAQLTGQDQGWDMFTPGFPPYTVIPFAELDFEDGRTERVYSRFDPVAFRQPVIRCPLLHDREFNYEANLFMLPWHFDPRLPASRSDQPNLPKKVRENEQLLTRWLMWQRHKNSDAVEVRLLMRYLPIARPGDPVELPFARWRVRNLPAPGKLPIEAYDPVTREYVSLDRWDEP